MKYLNTQKNDNFYISGEKLYHVCKGFLTRIDNEPCLEGCECVQYQTGVSIWHNGIVGNEYRQDVEFFDNKGNSIFKVSERDFGENVTLFPGTVTDKGVFMTIRFVGEQQFGLDDYKPDITRFYFYNGNMIESENFNDLIDQIEGRNMNL